MSRTTSFAARPAAAGPAQPPGKKIDDYSRAIRTRHCSAICARREAASCPPLHPFPPRNRGRARATRRRLLVNVTVGHLAAQCQNDIIGPRCENDSAVPRRPERWPADGAQLKALLAPASWFPRGFKIDQQGSVDTGNYYQPATPPGALECSRLDGTSWVQLGNGGAVSFAQNDYLDQNAGQYAQEIDVYQGSTAQDVMAKLRHAAASCRGFHDAQTSSTVTVTLEAGPRLGDDALTIRLQDPRWLGGTTLEAVRVGHAVATVYFSAVGGTGQAQATTLAAVLTANLQKNG